MPSTPEGEILDRLQAAPNIHPASARLFTDWTIEPGDVVTVQSGEEDYAVPVYSMDLSWSGAPMVEISSSGNQQREPLSELQRREYATGRGMRSLREDMEEQVSQYQHYHEENEVFKSDMYTITGVEINDDGQVKYDVERDDQGNVIYEEDGVTPVYKTDKAGNKVPVFNPDATGSLSGKVTQTAQNYVSLYELTGVSELGNEETLFSKITQNAWFIQQTVSQSGTVTAVFDPAVSYKVGDRVLYNNIPYRFTSAHTGAWTGTDVETVYDLQSQITQKDDRITNIVKRTGISETGTYTSLSSLIDQQAGKIGLVVVETENGNVIKRAGIVAAINENDESTVNISADKIALNGDTTLSGKLSVNSDGVTTISGQVGIGNISTGIVSINGGKVTAANYDVNINGAITFVKGINSYVKLTSSVVDSLFKDASVANNILTLTKIDGSTVNFSKATDLYTTTVQADGQAKKGGWAGGTFTVIATQTNKNTTTGQNETNEVNRTSTRLYDVELNGTPSASSTLPNYIEVPLKVTYDDGDETNDDKPDTGLSGAAVAFDASDFYNAITVTGPEWTDGTKPTGNTYPTDTMATYTLNTPTPIDKDLPLYLTEDESWSQHKKSVYLRANSVTATPKAQLIVDASGEYGDGETAGRNSVIVYSGVINDPTSNNNAQKAHGKSYGITGTVQLAYQTGVDERGDPVYTEIGSPVNIGSKDITDVYDAGWTDGAGAGQASCAITDISGGSNALADDTLKSTVSITASGTNLTSYSENATLERNTYTVGQVTNHCVNLKMDSIVVGRISTESVYLDGRDYGFGICHDSIDLSASSQTLAAGGSVTIYPKAKASATASSATNITNKGITITAAAAAAQRSATGLSDTITLSSSDTGTSNHTAVVEYDDDTDDNINVRINASAVYGAGQNSVTVISASLVANSLVYDSSDREATGSVLVQLSNGKTVTLTDVDFSNAYQAGLDGDPAITTQEYEFELVDGASFYNTDDYDLDVSAVYQKGVEDAAPANILYTYNYYGHLITAWASDMVRHVGELYPNTPVRITGNIHPEYTRYKEIEYQGIKGYIYHNVDLPTSNNLIDTATSPTDYPGQIGWYSIEAPTVTAITINWIQHSVNSYSGSMSVYVDPVTEAASNVTSSVVPQSSYDGITITSGESISNYLDLIDETHYGRHERTVTTSDVSHKISITATMSDGSTKNVVFEFSSYAQAADGTGVKYTYAANGGLINVRASASSSAKIIGQLYTKTKVTVVAVSGEYSRITFSGISGSPEESGYNYGYILSSLLHDNNDSGTNYPGMTGWKKIVEYVEVVSVAHSTSYYNNHITINIDPKGDPKTTIESRGLNNTLFEGAYPSPIINTTTIENYLDKFEDGYFASHMGVLYESYLAHRAKVKPHYKDGTSGDEVCIGFNSSPI